MIEGTLWTLWKRSSKCKTLALISVPLIFFTEIIYWDVWQSAMLMQHKAFKIRAGNYLRIQVHCVKLFDQHLKAQLSPGLTHTSMLLKPYLFQLEGQDPVLTYVCRQIKDRFGNHIVFALWINKTLRNVLPMQNPCCERKRVSPTQSKKHQ